MNTKSTTGMRIHMSQQVITEAEELMYSNSEGNDFGVFIEKVNVECVGLIKFIRKNLESVIKFAESYVPFQKTDVFIEALLQYCSLEIFSQNSTALAIPVIFHALVLYKHPTYYSILHKGLTVEEFNHVKSEISNVFRIKFPHVNNIIMKNITSIINSEIEPKQQYITGMFNYFSDFDYRRNTNKTLFKNGFGGKPLPVLNNEYYPVIYYTKDQILKKNRSSKCKYILLLNPYANQKLPLYSVEYNNELPGIDHIIYKDNVFHGLYRLRMRNLKEPAFQLILYNGKEYYTLCSGAAEEMKDILNAKRIDDINVSIYMSFNIWDEEERSGDNRYVKLVCNDISGKLKRSVQTITGLQELLKIIKNDSKGYAEDIHITGESLKKYLDGYSLRTIDIDQYVYLVNRELIRNSIYTQFPHRNPEMKANTQFREENNKMVNYRKQLNTMLNEETYKFRSLEEIRMELLKRVNSYDIGVERKILYEKLLNTIIGQIKYPLEPVGMEKLTNFNTMLFG